MQPDLIAAHQTQEIGSNFFRQMLQFRRCDLLARKPHIDKYGRVVAPVETHAIVDSLHERITGISHLQPVDPV